jgi:hypothetical protein
MEGGCKKTALVAQVLKQQILERCGRMRKGVLGSKDPGSGKMG